MLMVLGLAVPQSSQHAALKVSQAASKCQLKWHSTQQPVCRVENILICKDTLESYVPVQRDLVESCLRGCTLVLEDHLSILNASSGADAHQEKPQIQISS